VADPMLFTRDNDDDDNGDKY